MEVLLVLLNRQYASIAKVLSICQNWLARPKVRITLLIIPVQLKESISKIQLILKNDMEILENYQKISIMESDPIVRWCRTFSSDCEIATKLLCTYRP